VPVDGDSEGKGWVGKRRRGQQLTSLLRCGCCATGIFLTAAAAAAAVAAAVTAQYVDATLYGCQRRFSGGMFMYVGYRPETAERLIDSVF